MRRSTSNPRPALIAIASIALIALAALPSIALAQVEVFTLAGLPVTQVPADATVVELDAPARLDQRLSQGLPADPKAAAAIVRRRLKSFKARYGPDYRGLVRAWQLGVAKVPAVVVDGQYVVYGQPDVATALATIRRARHTAATP
ncbi:MAG: TIGR03757 family integrating conjugative element protein [Salinisphaera sp.]|jgi:integrating conjugative element protein (TIGR03757 family)|nr:TIGR03757 family integrating conjugative element protein [Salinisphaera sp.]